MQSNQARHVQVLQQPLVAGQPTVVAKKVVLGNNGKPYYLSATGKRTYLKKYQLEQLQNGSMEGFKGITLVDLTEEKARMLDGGDPIAHPWWKTDRAPLLCLPGGPHLLLRRLTDRLPRRC